MDGKHLIRLQNENAVLKSLLRSGGRGLKIVLLTNGIANILTYLVAWRNSGIIKKVIDIQWAQ